MERIESSFRDKAGYVFEDNGIIYRAVNYSYKECYDHLLTSGLYHKLVDSGLMIPFEEINSSTLCHPELYKIIKPERIQFISYPYEWAFSMLKDAALLTLKVQILALEHNMILKDASAFNVQFHKGKPVFIDSLSFEFYTANSPWIAYRQFCQHFLAPLALMANVDPCLNRMLILNIDGIPLNLAAKILPYKCHFNLGIYLHIFLHSKLQIRHENDSFPASTKKYNFPLSSMYTLLEGLKSTIENLRWEPNGTEWSDYTLKGVHTNDYTKFKIRVIEELIDLSKPEIVWDIGANIGDYSRIVAKKGNSRVISFDIDPACIEKNYLLVKEKEEQNILPLLLNITNSSPSIGWKGSERPSIYERERPDLIMALAIIHHLAIKDNIPLESIASHFANIANSLIIEFVPKEDEKVQYMLLNRADSFSDYTKANFETIFSEYFNIETIISADCNQRVFYLMKKK